ncbi:MAG: hypothetical protein CVT48_04630 [Thermoplasmata archaeon HGW-Thermoplasmata-1]|nr:MAG: hypothetical protein CVT48_04630 [Thermoplasmata archaeon HGW-Thermoplasmata-1]
MPKCCFRCLHYEVCETPGECCDKCDFYENGECIRLYVGANYKKKRDESYASREDHGEFEEADF